MIAEHSGDNGTCHSSDNVTRQTDDGGDNFMEVFVSCDDCDEWFQTMDTPMCHECHVMIHIMQTTPVIASQLCQSYREVKFPKFYNFLFQV